MRKTSLLVLAALVAVVKSADAAAGTATTAAATCAYDTDCTTADQCCLVS